MGGGWEVRGTEGTALWPAESVPPEGCSTRHQSHHGGSGDHGCWEARRPWQTV